MKVYDFYEKETHRCLADGTSICLDPHLAREEYCETAREATNAMRGRQEPILRMSN